MVVKSTWASWKRQRPCAWWACGRWREDRLAELCRKTRCLQRCWRSFRMSTMRSCRNSCRMAGTGWVWTVCLFWSAIVRYSSIHPLMSAFCGLLLSDIAPHSDVCLFWSAVVRYCATLWPSLSSTFLQTHPDLVYATEGALFILFLHNCPLMLSAPSKRFWVLIRLGAM